MSRRKYNQKFKAALKELNPAQREAVQTIEGPVLVVAGPGTGKTHILGARIGQILLQTDTEPHNILCLTYTDAGVHAMRNRLLEFIGPEAHKVHIFTFHSFCNTIIQDNAEVFGKRDLEPISELEKVELVREIIDTLPDDHELRRLKGEPYYWEINLRRLFELMKAENWTEKHILNKIDQYLAELPNREEYQYKRNTKAAKKGDPKTKDIEVQVRKMERLRSAAKLFPVYQSLMLARKRYDYDDMIQWTIAAFKEHKDLLRTYQEQYLYILVDEFQDTNGVQNQILQQLADYWENPNIFVVGDDDQSIFEFQGARVQNIIDFYKKYETLQLVVLLNNYRSSQHILDSAGQLIQTNELRLVKKLDDLKKELKASKKAVAKSTVKPKLVAYYNPLHEQADIVLQIEKLKNKGVPLSEIAVIYARHKQASELIKLLERKNIPYQAKRRINVFDLPIIRNTINLLAYLQKEMEKPFSGEKQLYEILYYNFVGLKPSDIARLSYEITKASKKENQRLFWREIISDEEQLIQFGVKHPKGFLRFSTFIENSLADYHNLTLPKLFERLLNRSGLLIFITSHEEKLWLMQVITTFFEFLKNETEKRPALNIRDLLDVIDRMKKNKIALYVLKTLYAEEGVKLVTAHSSKGLEFHHVFMLGCLKEYWQPSKRNSNFQFSLPDTLTLSVNATEDALEAARRLFYVSMTRAKEHLQISYSQYGINGDLLTRTQFIDEIETSDTVAIKKRHLKDDQLTDIKHIMLKEAIPPTLTSPLTTAELNSLLEGFTLSATALCKFLDCPLSFYFENILRVPSVSSVAAAFGTAIHHALKRVFDFLKEKENDDFPATDFVLREFDFELQRQRAYLSERQYRDRKMLGHQLLADFYNTRKSQWHKDAEVEREFRNIEVFGVPLTGVIDKIEFIKNDVLNVVDYKTGRYRSEKVQPPNEKNPLGGDYWRQVVFYKILLENYRNYQWKVVSGTIEYLEPYKNKIKIEAISTSDKDVKVVKEQITNTYKRIQKHDFFTGCGKEKCHWCNFAHDHILADHYTSTISEQLDE